MLDVKFYLDKIGKSGKAPVYLTIHDKAKIKIFTKVKIKPSEFDKARQRVKPTHPDAKSLNHYLNFLVERANDLLQTPFRTSFSEKEFKSKMKNYIQNYKEKTKPALVEEQMELYGRGITFIDLFAGAGGVSEGFLQAEYKDKFYDFLLASDINENCELTHLVRYNVQMNLGTKFICQDITDSDFIENLLENLEGTNVDVVCGGPPCQSFSLAGRRRKFDKKDDLFSHYLNVIKVLRPKYFVMENVKGILTKEKGKIKERVIREINSIIDPDKVQSLNGFVQLVKPKYPEHEVILDAISQRVDFEKHTGDKLAGLKRNFIHRMESEFKKLTSSNLEYHTSKTDKNVATIRHGLNMLARDKELKSLRNGIIKEKDSCHIDNDAFFQAFDAFIGELSLKNIIAKIKSAFSALNVKDGKEHAEQILTALELYISPADDALSLLQNIVEDEKDRDKLRGLLKSIRLYKLNKPLVLNASDYGVPQNRERVLFIGCRNDQKTIARIPPTVSQEEKVTVFEALWDLDFLDINEAAHQYKNMDVNSLYNGKAEQMRSLLKKREACGSISGKKGKMYSEWSKAGRLNGRFKHLKKPIYVRNIEQLKDKVFKCDLLHNHQTSNQSEFVVKRLKIILEEGGYQYAKERLEKEGVPTKKRNYSLLEPHKQSSTIMTIADDYIHYNRPRALTVREMARLQSFDDSFVFQGKRSTGGTKRKTEIPQFTLVGNAVPPLMARAVAMEILKHIK